MTADISASLKIDKNLSKILFIEFIVKFIKLNCKFTSVFFWAAYQFSILWKSTALFKYYRKSAIRPLFCYVCIRYSDTIRRTRAT